MSIEDEARLEYKQFTRKKSDVENRMQLLIETFWVRE